MLSKKSNNKSKGKGSNSRRQKEKAARRLEKASIQSDAASTASIESADPPEVPQEVNEPLPENHNDSTEVSKSSDLASLLLPSESSDPKNTDATEESSLSVGEAEMPSTKSEPDDVETSNKSELNDSVSEPESLDLLLPPPILPIESEIADKAVYTQEDDKEVVIIPIDTDPDFAILVTEEPYKYCFMVSKHIITRSSTAIRNIINSRTTETTSVKLVGDSNAMNIILRIIHFQSMDDVFYLTFEEVKNVAVICDKYKWHNVLRPWSRAWLQKYSKTALEPGYEDWLFIAKVFECDESVQDLLLVLSEQCGKASPCGEYIYRKGARICTKLWPEHHKARIAKWRQEKVDHLISLLRLFKDFANFDTDASADYCTSEACLNQANGSFNRSVRKSGLSELIEKGGNQWTGSVQELRQKLCELSFQTLASVTPNHSCWLGTTWENFQGRVCGQVMGEE
ncbi:hypothetical protein TWF281_003081 [Arthrobotrys megalospora]